MTSPREEPLEADRLNMQQAVDVDAVTGVARARRLAYASVTLLRAKGPLALAKQAGRWLGGERGQALQSLREMQDLGMDFHQWFLTQRATPDDLVAQRAQSARFTLRPLVSFVVPVYDPQPRVLAQTIASVLAQTYSNWELCLVDGASTRSDVRKTLANYAARDPRIRVTRLEQNQGIAGNSNAALAMAQGEFVTLLDHDDLIEPDLLYHVVEAINAHKDVDVVYYDEDLVSRNGVTHKRLLLKPAWSPELLLSTPLLTHSTIRRQLLRDMGGFDPAFEGTQDWDLFLRLSERIADADRIVRIPRVLYHWRMVKGSTSADTNAKPHVQERQLLAVQNHMQRLGAHNATASWAAPFVPRVVWAPQPTSVSIIIPTRGDLAAVRRCLDSISQHTADVQHYEVILVDAGSAEAFVRDYPMSQRHAPIHVARYDGQDRFNYARACNLGALHATGESLLFLHETVEVLDGDWLPELVRWSNLPQIGIVGAKFLDSHRRIQHAGVLLGGGGLAANLYRGAPEHGFSILGGVDWYRNCMAVTGGLQMMRREVFDKAHGYDEVYQAAYSDMAICVKAIERGYRVLYDPFVCLMRHESQTYTESTLSRHDVLQVGEDFRQYIRDGDPYFSPHLSYRAAWPRLRASDEPTREMMYAQLSEASLHEA